MTSTPQRQPAARASAARDNVGYVEVYRPGSLERVRSLIPADSLEAIDQTPGICWLDVEHDHWLMDGTIEVLGRDDAIACWRQSISQLAETPLLQTFIQGGLRLFASRPVKLLQLIPKGWTLAYRDFCTPRFEWLDDDSARLHFENVARQAFRSPGYIHCWHAICLGVLDLAKASDSIVEFEIDEPRGRAVASFRNL